MDQISVDANGFDQNIAEVSVANVEGSDVLVAPEEISNLSDLVDRLIAEESRGSQIM